MNRYRVVVVEDEIRSLNRLKDMLGQWSDLLEIVGEATSGTMARALIGRVNPDLVFMDIELPGMSGLKALEGLHPQPAIIFTTAYSDHAVPAFKSDHPIDYLLKPIKGPELEAAIRKFAGRHKRRFLNWLQCEIGSTIHLVKAAEIIYLHAEEKYTTVKTATKIFAIRKPIYALEKELDPEIFVRIHRSSIVNREWLKEIIRTDKGGMQVIMKDDRNSRLTASKSYADNLRFH